MSTTAENAGYIRHGIDEIFNRRNMAVADERFADQIVLHSPSQREPLRGRGVLKEFIGRLHTAFPDMQVTLEDLVAEGDRVVTRCTTRGTHDGDYFGTPPTGNRVTISEVQIYRVVDGRIVELWLVFNVLDVLQQLGVIPPNGLPRPLLELICWKQRKASARRRRAGGA